MNSSALLYFISVLFTFILTACWPGTPAAAGFAGRARLCRAGAGECLLALVEILSLTGATQAQAHFWFNLRFLFSGTIAVLFWYLRWNTMGTRLLTKPLVLVLSSSGAFPTFIWTSSLSGLWVKQDVGFHQSGPFWISDTSVRIPAAWFMVHSLYSLALLLAGWSLSC